MDDLQAEVNDVLAELKASQVAATYLLACHHRDVANARATVNLRG